MLNIEGKVLRYRSHREIYFGKSKDSNCVDCSKRLVSLKVLRAIYTSFTARVMVNLCPLFTQFESLWILARSIRMKV